MLHKGIPCRQVEGSKRGVNEKQMQGTRGRSEALLASDPAEQGWGASVLGALSECNSSCLCWLLSKTIKPDPKVHDPDVTVTSHSRTRGFPQLAHPLSCRICFQAAAPPHSFHLSCHTGHSRGRTETDTECLSLPQGCLKPSQKWIQEKTSNK